MDYKKLNDRLTEVLTGIHDHFFEDVINGIHCMSRPRVYGIINAIVSSLEPGEIYLEVGTYQGGSLVAALIGNETQAIAVDSFNEFTATNSLERTQTNLTKFGVVDRVKFHDMDFTQFFAEAAAHYGNDFTIQCYYYDGAHDYNTQLAGMEAAWAYLKPGSVIMVDDFTYPEVNAAVNTFISNHAASLAIQFIISGNGNMDPTWWNGFVCLKVI